MKKGLLIFGSAAILLLGAGALALADGIRSWSSDQFSSARPIYYWQGGQIERFVTTVEQADWEYKEEGWEAAQYWGQQSKRARHHTVSYYVDVGDLYYRMGNKRDALTYYHLARTVKRRTVEDHLELGEAFLYIQEPGLANFYFTEAMRFARSKADWMWISESFARLGNKQMAEITRTRSMELR